MPSGQTLSYLQLASISLVSIFMSFQSLGLFLILDLFVYCFKVMDENMGRKVGMIWEELREEISDQNTLYRKKSIKNGAQGRQDGLVG